MSASHILDLAVLDDCNLIRADQISGAIPVIVNAVPGMVAADQPVAVIRLRPGHRFRSDTLMRAQMGHRDVLPAILSHVRYAIWQGGPRIAFAKLSEYFKCVLTRSRGGE